MRMPRIILVIQNTLILILGVLMADAAIGVEALRYGAGPATWTEDLQPISNSDWNYERAAHLLERAGFGGTPAEIEVLAAMTPEDWEARRARARCRYHARRATHAKPSASQAKARAQRAAKALRASCPALAEHTRRCLQRVGSCSRV